MAESKAKTSIAPAFNAGIVSLPRLYGYQIMPFDPQTLESSGFDLFGTKSDSKNWRSNQAVTERTDEKLRACFNGSSLAFCDRYRGMLDFIIQNRAAPLDKKIEAAQGYVNGRTTYKPDADIDIKSLESLTGDPAHSGTAGDSNKIRRSFASNDYWNTYEETFLSGHGDCEDYAIMKYNLLRLMGVPEDRLFIVTGATKISDQSLPRDKEGDIDRKKAGHSYINVSGAYYGGHVVMVALKEDGKPVVLGNDTAGPGQDHIGDASMKTDRFIPTAAFNGKGSYLFQASGADDPQAQLERAIRGKNQAERSTASPAASLQ